MWTDSSSRLGKQDFESVDPSSVLEQVIDLDVMRWQYKAELGSVHMGPVAEDFRAAFGLGADDRHIQLPLRRAPQRLNSLRQR